MVILLVSYCALIVLASLVGGLVPLVVRLTHRRMQMALSFVSGVMLGVALLHMAPHAWNELAAAGARSVDGLVRWILSGFLIMFLLERFFCFHHHEPLVNEPADEAPPRVHQHDHTLNWTGAMIGLTVHSLLAGVALAASVEAESHGGHEALFAGLGTFLVILLHKPFDALTIGTLMAAGKRSRRTRHVINLLFALAVPMGAALFAVGVGSATGPAHQITGAALAFTAGMFLCIALSDLLPELQFHQHDRVKLTLALLAGIILAWVVGLFEDGHAGSATCSILDSIPPMSILLAP